MRRGSGGRTLVAEVRLIVGILVGSLRDALSGETVELDEALLRPPRINNAVRRALRPVIAQLQLSSPDVAVRLAAAQELTKRPRPEMMGLLQAALERETEAAVRAVLAVSLAQMQLQSDDPTVRLAAIRMIGESGNLGLRPQLEALVATNEDGSFAEADLVVWEPKFFGVKPELILKGGFIAWAAMGDPNASIPTPQPVFGRPMFGHLGRAPASLSVSFVSRAAYENGLGQQLRLQKPLVPVQGCRSVGKKDLVHNQALPEIEVNPETYVVKADGEILTCEPARVLPLAQRYFLF